MTKEKARQLEKLEERKKAKKAKQQQKEDMAKETGPDGQRYRKSVRYYMNFAIIGIIVERDSLSSCGGWIPFN